MMTESTWGLNDDATVGGKACALCNDKVGMYMCPTQSHPYQTNQNIELHAC